MIAPDDQHTIRTFIAIPIPQHLGDFLEKIQAEIKANRVNASWTKRSSMHLTLRFFGETTEDKIKMIIQAMQETTAAIHPFSISAKGIGVFPKIKNARVIWAGVSGQTGQLLAVNRSLSQTLSQKGIRSDSNHFSPHFTLGRLRKRPDRNQLKTIIQDFENHESAPCLIQSMVLFKSDLKPSGAVHTPIFKAVFSGSYDHQTAFTV